MYGNTSFADGSTTELTTEQRRRLRQDLVSAAARTRALLPEEFAVGSELSRGSEGPRATVAVQPPLGSVVSAEYDLDGEISNADEAELARGLAAAAALQVKQAMSDELRTAAQ